MSASDSGFILVMYLEDFRILFQVAEEGYKNLRPLLPSQNQQSSFYIISKMEELFFNLTMLIFTDFWD